MENSLSPIRYNGKLDPKEDGSMSGHIGLLGVGAMGLIWVLTSSSIGVIAGLVVVGAIYWKRSEHEENRQDAINANAIAPILSPKQLQQYRDEVGTARVVQELNWAKQNHLKLPRKHQQLLEEVGGEHPVLTLTPGDLNDATHQFGYERVLQEFDRALRAGYQLTPAQQEYVDRARAAIGIPTVDVQAAPVPEVLPPAPTPAIDVPVMPIELVEEMAAIDTLNGSLAQPWDEGDEAEPESDDIVDLIIAQGNSLVFLGGQGVGKSLLMAKASQHGLQNGKFKHVTVCSGLAKQNEDPHYWHMCQNQLFYDLAPMNEIKRSQHIEKQLKAIRRFKQVANNENPGLLILDEIAYLASLLAAAPEGSVERDLEREICDVLRVVASGGAKRGWFIWVGTPQGAIGGMGAIGKELKRLKPVFCAVSPASTVESRGNATVWDQGLFSAAKVNFPSLKEPPPLLEGRIVFFNDQWMSQSRYDLQEPKADRPSRNAGQEILAKLDALLQRFGAIRSSQVVQICGTHDIAKRIFLVLSQQRPDYVAYSTLGDDAVLTLRQDAQQKKPLAAV